MKIQKQVTLITRHYFSSNNRKTTVHFIAREFAKKGYLVNFISVGRSLLSTFNKPEGKGIPKDISRNNFTEVEPNIFSIVMDEWLHPISSRSGIISFLTSPNLIQYGKRIPRQVQERVVDSDVVLIECGYGVAYFDYLKKICNKAKFIYFATDPLTQVGLRKEFEVIEMNSITKFDLVRVASEKLAERFPKQTKLVVIPQGLDKNVFDNANISPYKMDRKNFVSIGDMSFDYNSIVTMAKLMPQADFHIFGADIPDEFPSNITVYGEIDFDKLVPFIKFADVGIMPYKMDTEMEYLTKTSLKFLQYSYCGLPIVTPVGPDWARKNVFQYQVGNNISIKNSLDKAISSSKDQSLGKGILDWSDCAEKLLSTLG
jgi:2-beta-glucuronyltransferase